jgi:acylphosphatase
VAEADERPDPPADEPACVRVVVSGRVQGVFYRDSCRRSAAGAGLTGWVRNTAEGGVEAWFEGDRPAVERMVAWCRQGPPGARVTGVEVVPETPAGTTGFRVR